jgi:DeoR family fructose operon transcriptional repressor
MLAQARRSRIVDILARSEDGVVTLKSLSDQFGVSEMTIRRDLDWLQSQALVNRVRGGAVAQAGREEMPFSDRLRTAGAQKKAIAWAAVGLVADGDRIILDGGTTTQQIAANLGCKNGLTVITNNVAAVTELASCGEIETIILGGSLKHQELCTVGPLVTQGLADLTADKLFLSTAGFSIRQGVTDLDMSEAQVKRAMIAAAAQVILVADSSKWGLVKLVRVAPIRDVDILVSDDDLPAEAIVQLEAEGVEVITPSKMAVRAGVSAGEAVDRAPVIGAR